MARAKGTIEQQFSFTAPTAVSVMLVGDFTEWEKNPISMERQSGGIWKTAIPLRPGQHHYRFLVDGEWRDDPESTIHVMNPYGSENSVREVAR